MTEATYTVQGMTCGHCVGSVKEEVGGLAGVQTVDVDLATGAVKVTSAESISREAVEAAVAEAGYQVVA